MSSNYTGKLSKRSLWELGKPKNPKTHGESDDFASYVYDWWKKHDKKISGMLKNWDKREIDSDKPIFSAKEIFKQGNDIINHFLNHLEENRGEKYNDNYVDRKAKPAFVSSLDKNLETDIQRLDALKANIKKNPKLESQITKLENDLKYRAFEQLRKATDYIVNLYTGYAKTGLEEPKDDDEKEKDKEYLPNPATSEPAGRAQHISVSPKRDDTGRMIYPGEKPAGTGGKPKDH